MKIRHIILIFCFAFFLVIIGSLFKVMQWPGAGVVLAVGLSLKVIAAILAVWKAINSKQLREVIDY